jgi:hypothetical protein
MNRTNLSLYYLAGYLLPAGLGLLLAPEFVMTTLFSNAADTYGDRIPRAVGVLAFSLGIIIVQIIRLRLHQLYTTTMVVRVWIVTCFFGLYVYSSDPFFLALVGIVGFGLALTATTYTLDRRDAARAFIHRARVTE